MRHYLIVDPPRRLAVHHGRRGPDEPILTRIVREGALRFDPPGLVVELADCFATLDPLERDPDADTPG